MRLDRERILDILESIEKIEKRTNIDWADFSADEMLQVWTIHYIQIIGEAASKLSLELRGGYPEIPWIDIIDMRNVLVHHYFGIDLNQIWDTIKIDIPNLKKQMLSILEKL